MVEAFWKIVCNWDASYTLPETNSHFAPENRPFNAPKGKEKVFQPSIFRCYVSFREWILHIKNKISFINIGDCWWLEGPPNRPLVDTLKTDVETTIHRSAPVELLLFFRVNKFDWRTTERPFTASGHCGCGFEWSQGCSEDERGSRGAPKKNQKPLQDGKLFSSSFPVWECCDALCFIRKVCIDVLAGNFLAIFCVLILFFGGLLFLGDLDLLDLFRILEWSKKRFPPSFCFDRITQCHAPQNTGKLVRPVSCFLVMLVTRDWGHCSSWCFCQSEGGSRGLRALGAWLPWIRDGWRLMEEFLVRIF